MYNLAKNQNFPHKDHHFSLKNQINFEKLLRRADIFPIIEDGYI